MTKHSVAEEVVVQLGNYGVKQIFGITGDALNVFTNAIRKQGSIEWFTVRHEETAAFAAAAQAELTQTLAVCAGTVGPGALHLVNGLYNAKRDRCPVLAITGHVARAENHGPYFQEVDIDKAFEDICVFQETLRSPEQMPRILQQAINAAVSQRGVAHLAIPTDIAVAMIESHPPIVFPTPPQVAVPTEQDIDRLAQLVNQAKRVSLLIGRGARDAKAQVIALADKLQAPVVHSLKGSEAIDYDHPLSIGGIGNVGTPHGLATLGECELLLMLGTDFPYPAFLPSNCQIVQVDICPEHVGRRVNLTQGLVGDVGLTVNALLEKVQTKQNPSLAKLQEKRDKWLAHSCKQFTVTDKTTGPIHPQTLVTLLSELADDDAVFCCDIGEITVWAARYLKLRGKQRLLSSFNHGSLGVGLPAAIGVQALDRKRQVIAVSGDGGFGMLMADLVTASRYELPITQIILNNGKFGFVELEMEATGMPRYATDLVNPDFAKVAEACGFAEGIAVRDPKQLKVTLEHALKTPKPILLDVFTNPSELIMPPKLEPLTAYKFMQGKIREMVVEKDMKVLFEK